MTFATSPRAARAWRALRFAGLALVALLLAHDGLFAAEYGLGPRMDRAMTAGGHDGWWTPYALSVLVVAIALAVGAARRIRRLAGVEASRRTVERSADLRGYPREFGGLWRSLFPVVTAGLLVQENLEHLATSGHLAGLAPIGSPAALIAIALVTATVALVGALVRWRIRVLETRIAAARRRAWRHSAAASVPARAWIVAAVLMHRRLLDRDDPGRAPPAVLAI